VDRLGLMVLGVFDIAVVLKFDAYMMAFPDGCIELDVIYHALFVCDE